MSRANYTDDMDDGWAWIRWRGAVASAVNGRRGQALLRELLAALDAMPEKSLIADALTTPEGEMCALGVVGTARGVDLSDIDPDEPWEVSRALDIAEALAQEIAFENDDGPYLEEPSHRWRRMRAWTERNILT